ncbi:MAG TPA: hypothetical protein VFQ45_21270 [Longimicrobium sp.]|nr:hypothetical protein [Longimicrobium sp.]
MTWTRGADYLERLQAALTTGEPSSDTPEGVVRWLARLRLLVGVPFYYLVPDARMLPPESIRFFQVDENWLAALVDGALSIGRSSTTDAEREAARSAAAAAAAKAASPTLRAAARADAAKAKAWLQSAIAAQEAAGAITAEQVAEAQEALQEAAAEARLMAETPVSGFILRSAVVSGWPGMEVRAYTDAAMTAKADIIRLERVADDILFGLFGQEAAVVQFSEPSETLHFGFEQPEQESDPYVKILKYVDADGHAAGSEMGATVDAPFRDGGRRVVDVATLQAGLQAALVASGGLGSTDPWTAAEFALEMVQGVEEVNYTVETGG